MPANFLQCSSHRPVLFFASFLRRYEVASIAESLRAFTSGHFQAQAADATYLGGSGQPVVSEVLQSPGWGAHYTKSYWVGGSDFYLLCRIGCAE